MEIADLTLPGGGGGEKGEQEIIGQSKERIPFRPEWFRESPSPYDWVFQGRTTIVKEMWQDLDRILQEPNRKTWEVAVFGFDCYLSRVFLPDFDELLLEKRRQRMKTTSGSEDPSQIRIRFPLEKQRKALEKLRVVAWVMTVISSKLNDVQCLSLDDRWYQYDLTRNEIFLLDFVGDFIGVDCPRDHLARHLLLRSPTPSTSAAICPPDLEKKESEAESLSLTKRAKVEQLLNRATLSFEYRSKFSAEELVTTAIHMIDLKEEQVAGLTTMMDSPCQQYLFRMSKTESDQI